VTIYVAGSMDDQDEKRDEFPAGFYFARKRKDDGMGDGWLNHTHFGWVRPCENEDDARREAWLFVSPVVEEATKKLREELKVAQWRLDEANAKAESRDAHKEGADVGVKVQIEDLKQRLAKAERTQDLALRNALERLHATWDGGRRSDAQAVDDAIENMIRLSRAIGQAQAWCWRLNEVLTERQRGVVLHVAAEKGEEPPPFLAGLPDVDEWRRQEADEKQAERIKQLEAALAEARDEAEYYADSVACRHELPWHSEEDGDEG